MKRRRTPSSKKRSGRKKPVRRTRPPKKPEPAAAIEPPIHLPGPEELKALSERLANDQLLPKDSSKLLAVLDFRAQLPELLCREGMTVQRLGELMGLTGSEPTEAAETDDGPNPQTSHKDDTRRGENP